MSELVLLNARTDDGQWVPALDSKETLNTIREHWHADEHLSKDVLVIRVTNAIKCSYQEALEIVDNAISKVAQNRRSVLLLSRKCAAAKECTSKADKVFMLKSVHEDLSRIVGPQSDNNTIYYAVQIMSRCVRELVKETGVE